MHLLHELAVQLAIAIQQAELYNHLRTLNAQLVSKVKQVEEHTSQIQETNRFLLKEVSDRQRTEVALRESETTIRALIRAIPDLLMQVRQDGTYLNIHESDYIKLLNPERMKPGVNICDVLPVPVASDRLQRIQEVLTTGKPQVYEYELTINGEVVYEEARITPCSKDTVLVMVRDVSSRKHAELALRRSEATNRAILSAIPDVLIQMQRDGSFLTAANIGKVKLLNPERIGVGFNLYDALPAHLARQRLEYVRQVLDTRQPVTYEYEIVVDGETLHEEARIVPCGEDDVLIMVRDVTDRKQFETALQQANAELSRATKLKDEFLANMSHELRTPLNAVLGLSEGLLSNVYGGLNDRQRKAITTIERSGRHLLELINDILDLSKIEAGKLELNISPTPVARLCNASLAMVQQLALSKRIQLTSHIPDNLGSVDVDERRIRQVLINLLGNAVKFTPEGGSVTLEVSLDAPQCELEPSDRPALDSESTSWIVFATIDTGIGIALEDRQKLFQPFVQIDSGLSRRYEGTGLGLSLVHRIVALHGGRVSVESEPGKGSRFTIYLPAQVSQNLLAIADEEEGEPYPTGQEDSPPPTPPETHPLVLLAEDNEANIQLLSSFLTSKGYRCDVARNGLEVFKKARQYHPDLILMDVHMPLVDGLQATAKIRNEANLAHIPIVALTALAMPGDRDRCLEAGVTEYLTKPIRLKQLEKVLHHLLGARAS